MKSYRDIRVLPVVLIAIIGLAVLKIAGLVIDGGYVFDYQPKSTERSWAQENLNFPAGNKPDPADITGSLQEKPKEEAAKGEAAKGESAKGEAAKGEAAKGEAGKAETAKEDTAKPGAPPEAGKPDGVVVYPDQAPPVSPSERAILERLQSRRQELDARAREIDIRESLLKAAEKRLESKAEEIKAVESRVATATEQKSETDAARFKGIVTMYEAMKPKDAAKVFDRLEMSVLFEIASKIAPRKMSDILGLMSPEAAERLTVEMARQAGADKATPAADLPKIEGKVLPQKAN
jgi:flagellar motility protein MotE (MotC chaperone)